MRLLAYQWRKINYFVRNRLLISPRRIYNQSSIKAIVHVFTQVKSTVHASVKVYEVENETTVKIALLSSESNSKMFSMDPFDFETVMSRHLFEGGSLLNQTLNNSQGMNHSSNSNSSNDYFLCEDSITDTDSFNSDQENNNEIKEWVERKTC